MIVLSLAFKGRCVKPIVLPVSLFICRWVFVFLQFLGDHLSVECFEQEFINTGALRFEFEEEDEEGPQFTTTPSLEDKMPFLQMLQSVGTPSVFPFKEPNFQTLLRLQHLKKPWELVSPFMPEMEETQIQALEFESCVTQETLDLHSPVKLETKDLQNPHSVTSCIEGLSSESNQEHIQVQPNSDSVINITHPPQQQIRAKQSQFSKSPPITREKRKRKRTKPIKNKEEVESQRMTHIAVERNRRRQMNDHLNTLRSLMPPAYVQRVKQSNNPSAVLNITTKVSFFLSFPSYYISLKIRFLFSIFFGWWFKG